MRRSLGIWSIWTACLLLAGGAARADENYFGYSYSAEVLPKGSLEVYSWTTWRTGKNGGSYNGFDLQQEIEYGFTDRLQGSLYLTENFFDVNRVSLGEEEEEGGEGLLNEHGFGFSGIKGELKYMLWSPYEKPIGIALYVEPGYSRIDHVTGERENAFFVETKLILQKNFLDDQLVTVLNITPELEYGKARGEKGRWGHELEFEVTGGVAYRLAPGWYLGLEGRYTSEYPDWPSNNHREFYGVFVGPAVHYSAERWWFTLTVLPQVYGSPQDEDGSSHLHLDDLERVETRLKVGYNF